jgi:hypothetical protein
MNHVFFGRRRPTRVARVAPALALALLATMAPAVVTAEQASAAASCPCTLWADSTVPAIVDFNDAAAVELGTQFSADYDGVVSGVRFYKSEANTGTHIGSLWTSTGSLLAQVTFTAETADGWQRATFDQPVPVTANTNYVISYHTNVGHYSVTPQYFSGDYDAAPLHAPSGNGANNGLFAYSPVPTFPTGTYNGNNYWVSPVFAPALRSIAVSPNPVSVGVGLTTALTATGQYTDGSSQDLTAGATWSASGSAKVSAAGVVTGTAAGSATVTATLGAVSGSTAVTVTAPVLRSLTVSPSPAPVIAGIPVQLSLTGAYSDGSTKNLTSSAAWSSSAATRATVSAAGLLTGKAAGPATVTATVAGLSASTTVTVRTITSVDVVPLLSIIKVGRQVQLTAIARLSDGSTANVTSAATWCSALPTVATVSATGLVTGKRAGVGVVFATVGGRTDLGLVNVTP